MIRLQFIFLAIFASGSVLAQDHSLEFKVMAWNILHGANDIPDGPLHAIDIIRELDPDIILMVETYGSGKRIADSLGLNFHLVAPEGTALDDESINLSVMSKYSFGKRLDTDFPFYLGGREVLIGDHKVRCLSNWFYYLPWDNEPENMGMSAEELLEWERAGKRYEMIQEVLPYLKEYIIETDSFPLIFGGDMNTFSHLDWGESTKAMHNDLVVPWYASKVIEDLGFTDSYREVNPNVLTHPGITWNAKGRKDEHRIDYVFYKGEVLEAVESKSYQAYLGEKLELNGKLISYPSDHGIVVTTFRVREQ